MSDLITLANDVRFDVQNSFGGWENRWDGDILTLVRASLGSPTFPFRFDANETAMFARQLEHIMSQTFDIEFPEVKWRRLFSVNTEVNPGALFHTWRQMQSFGQPRLATTFGSTDLTSVEINGKEQKRNIYSYLASYGYSIQDMRAAAMAGINLDQKKAEAVRLAFEQQMDIVSAVGIKMGSTLECEGLTNAVGISALTSVPNSGTLNGSWDDPNQSVDAIMQDVKTIAKRIKDDTKMVYGGNLQLLLPTPVFTALESRPRSITFTDDSVLQYIMKQQPSIKSIEQWVQLDALGHNSATTAGFGMGLIKDMSPRVAELILSQDFEQFPPQLEALRWMIPCHIRTGGWQVRYPKAIVTVDGLQK